MTTLILCTSLSNLLIHEILIEHNNQSGDVIILSTNTSANKSLKEIGLPSQFISTSIEQSWTDRDSEFRELCLPGVFGDTKFAGTQLEIYKVLGIDRLNFWYNGINGEQMCHYIESLKWNKLIVSLDLYHHLPLYSMYLAKERGAYCKAVKTHAVLSREFYDIAKLLSCNEIVVETDSELKFLKEKGYWGKVTKRNLKLKEEIVTTQESPAKEGLRKGLGLSNTEFVIGVVFDKKYEWQCRKFLNNILSQPTKPTLMMFSFDDRSIGLFPNVLKPYKLKLYGNDLIKVCDQIVAFGYEDYLNSLSDVSIIDYSGINKALEIVPDSIKVYKE